MRNPVDPRHSEIQGVLRVVGPVMVVAGLAFTAVGLGSFFSAFGSFEPPRYFWCAFVGLPLLAIGVGLTKFAYLGAITRYVSGEVAPVGKDVVRYMATETKDSVRDVAAAVSEGLGLRSRKEPSGARFAKCGVENDVEANFCKACGGPIARAKICGQCGDENGPDARYCDHCGSALA